MTSISDIMEPHRARLAALTDDDLLAHLRDLEPLPDESEPAWFVEGSPLWDRCGEFLAFADEVALRHLRDGIGLLLERACFGDPFETMRGLRHSLERTVDGDWPALTAICMSAVRSDRPGARLWALFELAILRDPEALPTIAAGLRDPEALVRGEACRAIEMLSQTHPEEASELASEARRVAQADDDPEVRRMAGRAIEAIQARS